MIPVRSAWTYFFVETAGSRLQLVAARCSETLFSVTSRLRSESSCCSRVAPFAVRRSRGSRSLRLTAPTGCRSPNRDSLRRSESRTPSDPHYCLTSRSSRGSLRSPLDYSRRSLRSHLATAPRSALRRFSLPSVAPNRSARGSLRSPFGVSETPRSARSLATPLRTPAPDPASTR